MLACPHRLAEEEPDDARGQRREDIANSGKPPSDPKARMFNTMRTDDGGV
jgi:hypothetical protein